MCKQDLLSKNIIKSAAETRQTPKQKSFICEQQMWNISHPTIYCASWLKVAINHTQELIQKFSCFSDFFLLRCLSTFSSWQQKLS